VTPILTGFFAERKRQIERRLLIHKNILKFQIGLA